MFLLRCARQGMKIYGVYKKYPIDYNQNKSASIG